MSLELFCDRCGLPLAFEIRDNMRMVVSPCEQCMESFSNVGVQVVEESSAEMQDAADDLTSSDTTTDIMREPGGPAGDPMAEDSEGQRSYFDRKFKKTLDCTGEVYSG